MQCQSTDCLLPINYDPLFVIFYQLVVPASGRENTPFKTTFHLLSTGTCSFARQRLHLFYPPVNSPTSFPVTDLPKTLNLCYSSSFTFIFSMRLFMPWSVFANWWVTSTGCSLVGLKKDRFVSGIGQPCCTLISESFMDNRRTDQQFLGTDF